MSVKAVHHTHIFITEPMLQLLNFDLYDSRKNFPALEMTQLTQSEKKYVCD